jgi:hypothetical protein
MRSFEQLFATKVELPCKVYCGPDSMVQLAATALSIDTGSLVLALGVGVLPLVGARVKLEVLLPANQENPTAKCLSLRAKVTRTTELPDGSCRVELSFRKANFKDVEATPRQKLAKAAKAAKAPMNGWAM